MDIQNHFYGHSAALAAYAGMTRPRHIDGLIQHGWTVASPVATHFADLASAAPCGHLFVWSHRARGWSPADPDVNPRFRTTAIGAPFLYLLQIAGPAPKAGEGPAVVFPFHGTRLHEIEGDQRAFARQVLDREGPSLISIHSDDLRRPQVVDAWRSAGHTITSAGDRRDPAFLGRQLWLLQHARTVVSNRLATATMYGAVAGRPIRIYGPDFRIPGGDEAASDANLRRLWPEFYEEEPDPAMTRSIAETELGLGDLRTVVELKQLLGWNRPNPRPAVRYWAGAPLRKAAMVLNLTNRPEGTKSEVEGVSPFTFLKDPLEHLPAALPRRVVTGPVQPEVLIRP